MLMIPVVLSGGAGSRLWPVSREGHPKPFMKLPDGETLIQKTYRRAASLQKIHREDGQAKILTVTNREYYFMSRDVLERCGAGGTFLLEPFGRNTAPAIALAAHRVQARYGSDALMLVLSADHLIQNEFEFGKAVDRASELAQEGYLVTFGIVPHRVETGFGYIKYGNKISGGGYLVDAFVEKPDLETARTYFESGTFLWNSGMFCFSAGNFLSQLKSVAPEVASRTKSCWNRVMDAEAREPRMIEIPEPEFALIPSISVDYALMEKADSVAVVQASMGWSDVGTWDAIKDLVLPDLRNNRASGDVVFVNTKNTYVQSEDRMVAVVGVDGLMVIDTKDALLIASENSSQDVKTIVGILKESGNNLFKTHKTVVRPWGTYTVLEDGPGFKIKRIEVKPGGRLSLQKHLHRSEHWIVVAGEASVTNGSCQTTVLSNQSTFIPAGNQHRLENKTNNDLIIIEVQCGLYLDEDDIVRLEDSYGRI